MTSSQRALEVFAAAVACVVALPVALVAAVLVKATSRGPVLHRARRVGRHGAPLDLLKLRTMRVGCGGPAVAGARDPRVTRVGRVLRALHIDEVPQLLQILRGELSLVGPRPEDPAFVDIDDPRWREILSVRPGLTGPTQLAFSRIEAELLADGDAERIYRQDLLPGKIASDLAYVRSRSFRTDLGCLVRTLGVWLPGRSRGPVQLPGPA